ncbi:hypothetical protein SOVF_154730, partial [Spinacia oleracea]
MLTKSSHPCTQKQAFLLKTQLKSLNTRAENSNPERFLCCLHLSPSTGTIPSPNRPIRKRTADKWECRTPKRTRISRWDE